MASWIAEQEPPTLKLDPAPANGALLAFTRAGAAEPAGPVAEAVAAG